MPPKVQYRKYRYEPTLGVKSDFEVLLQSFASKGTVRYQKFAECWREMNMACYCAGRQTKREAREFVEHCFHIATQFWLPPSSFLVRSGALYLLYGLYNFQLVIPKVKIRVTPEQWRIINEFHLEAREQQHLDLDYVFQKLLLDKAFQFVAFPEEVILGQRGPEDAKIIPESMKEDSCMLDDIFSNSALNQLSLVHEQYQKMKLALSGDDTSEPDTTLSIIHTDLIQGIHKTLRTHRERQIGIAKSHMSKDGNLQELEEEKQQMYKPSEASVQKKLKQKAFELGTAGYRQRGQSQDASKDTGEETIQPEESSSSTRPAQKRCRHVPALYEKDEGENTPVNIPVVHELFCMPKIDSIVAAPSAKTESSQEDMDTGSDERELEIDTDEEGEERIKRKKAPDTDGAEEETESDVIKRATEKTSVKRKRKSSIEDKSKTKMSKSEEESDKEMSKLSKRRSSTASVKKKVDKKVTVKPNSKSIKKEKTGKTTDQEIEFDFDHEKVDEKAKVKPKSKRKTEKTGKTTGQAIEVDFDHEKLVEKAKVKPNSKTKEKTVESIDYKVELSSDHEKSGEKEQNTEKELSAQEKLQMKLTQRKKEARLKTKVAGKGKNIK